MNWSHILISDVDGTLLGDDAALEAWKEWLAARRSSLGVVYSSGRFASSVLADVYEGQLPKPDAVIGGVGTEIEVLTPRQHFLYDWQETFHDWNHEGIRETLAEFDALELQPPKFIAEYKLSYYAHDLSDEQVGALGQALRERGFRARIVYSSNRDLDVLPEGADKGHSAAFLAEHWGMRPEQVIVAGDSGNDLAMFHRGFRGVTVGNAHDELRSLIMENVFHAERTHAAGVLEGLAHWLDRGSHM